MPMRWALKKNRRIILAPRYEKALGSHECEHGTAAVPTHGPFYVTKKEALQQRRGGEVAVRVRITEDRRG